MRHFSFVLLLSCFAIVGCNAQIDAKVTPTQAATQPNLQLDAKVVPTQAATQPDVQINAQVKESTKSEAPQIVEEIVEGRYWIGGTDQALEVQGDASGTGRPARFRYETEGGVQEWRSLSSLQAIKPGVVYDGNDYWCLSTMQPKTGIAICSKEGWVTQQEPSQQEPSQSEPSQSEPSQSEPDQKQ
ncbi:MAG: hypothetical protein J0L70_09525 [Leptolyngbya sp. UWPOB_LEPTO1]|uniref:hypothetical protein n=1 Tax=Leptolyngbya sp. UWPOB_LEPTO1 TaxID=2815653 RepID=UPI001AC423BC|nr:hypothetical protein [Leptolyngbya sp. UWPOB_LEPTO1]MBN8560750.1 hypothetical protein [Leptolyngbya sp. UWPOB_LEPTO1]